MRIPDGRTRVELYLSAFLLSTCLAMFAMAAEAPQAPEWIPNRYIVRMAPATADPDAVAAALAAQYDGRVLAVWKNALQGFWIEIPAERAHRLADDPRVAAVEQDSMVHTSQQGRVETNAPTDAQKWHLKRLGYRSITNPPATTLPTSPYDGNGVKVYLIDTSVWAGHNELAGLPLTQGRNAAVDPYDPRMNLREPLAIDHSSSLAPCGGAFPVTLESNSRHGTMVGSLIVGKTLGVAKGVQLVSVGMQSCVEVNGALVSNTSTALLIDAVEWVVSNATRPAVVSISAFKTVTGETKCIGNRSCTGGSDLALLETAVQALIDKGIPVIVSANNKELDACITTPPRLSRRGGRPAAGTSRRGVITVGGTADTDERFTGGPPDDPGSNHGVCVDIFAPAKGIAVPSTIGSSSYQTLSGTSFAAPMVAAIAARLLQEDSTLTVDDLWERLRVNATPLTTNLGFGSPSLLAYLGGVTFTRQEPAEKVVKASLPYTLSVDVLGDPNTLTYAWYRGDYDAAAPVPPSTTPPPPIATTRMLTRTALAATDVTEKYWVRVSRTTPNGVYFADSNRTAIRVGTCPRPSIAKSPQSVWDTAGKAVTLTAQIAVDSASAVKYEWQRVQPVGQAKDGALAIAHQFPWGVAPPGTSTTVTLPVTIPSSGTEYYRLVLKPDTMCEGQWSDVVSDIVQVRAECGPPADPEPEPIPALWGKTVHSGTSDILHVSWFYTPFAKNRDEAPDPAAMARLELGCTPLGETCNALSDAEIVRNNGATWEIADQEVLYPPMTGWYAARATNACGESSTSEIVPMDTCGAYLLTGTIGTTDGFEGEVSVPFTGKPVQLGVHVKRPLLDLGFQGDMTITWSDSKAPAPQITDDSSFTTTGEPGLVITATADDKDRGCTRTFTFRFTGTPVCKVTVARKIVDAPLLDMSLLPSQAFTVPYGSQYTLRAETNEVASFTWTNEQGTTIGTTNGTLSSDQLVTITGNTTIKVTAKTPSGCTITTQWVFRTVPCNIRLTGLLQGGSCGRATASPMVITGAQYRIVRLGADILDDAGVRLAPTVNPPGSSTYLPNAFKYTWTLLAPSGGRTTLKEGRGSGYAEYEQRIEADPKRIELSVKTDGSCPAAIFIFEVASNPNLTAPSQCALPGATCSYVCGRQRAVRHNGTEKTTVLFTPGETAVLTAPAESQSSTYAWFRRIGTTETQIGTTPEISVVFNVPAEYYVVTTTAGETSISYTLVAVQAESDIRVTVTPTSRTITVGSPASFTASLSGADGTTQYEWRSGQSYSLNAMVIGRSPTLTLYGLQDHSTFWCRVIQNPGTAGEIVSKSPFVTVFVNCGNSLSGVAVARPDRLARGQQPMLLPATNGKLVSYTWSRSTPSGSPVVFSTKQNPTPDLTDPITYFTAAAVDACGQTTQIGPAVAYLCVPTITQQPIPTGVKTGQTPTLTVGVTPAIDGQPLTVKWYRASDTAMTTPLGTGLSFQPSLAAETSDSFFAAITSTCGTYPHTIRTESAMVEVCAPPVISTPIPVYWTNPGLQVDIQIFDSNPVDEHTYQWYVGQSGDTSAPRPGEIYRSMRIQPLTTGRFWCRATSRGLCTTDSGTITVEVCTKPNITTQPQSDALFTGQTASLSVAATTTAPQPFTYRWQKLSGTTWTDIVGATAATYTTPPFAGTTLQYRAIVNAGAICDTTSNSAVISGCRNPEVVTVPEVKVAYNTSGSLSLPVLQPGTRNITWYRGDVGVRSAPVKSGSGQNLTYVTPLLTQTTYYWAEFTEVDDGCVSRTGPAKVNVCVPAITTQPIGKTIASGGSATLTVAAIPATAGLTYQWFIGEPGTTTTMAPNGTAASLTVSPAATTQYWCRVTSNCARVEHSAAATVTVCNPPQITSATTSQSIQSGWSTTLAVAATGSNLTYQWYKGTAGVTTTPIAGATFDAITVQPTATTSYWCRITSEGLCTKDSGTITVDVCTLPVINTQPVSRYAFSGATSTLTVAASPAQSTYQWYTGASGTTSSPVTGATSATLTVAPAVTTSYWCRVKNGICTVNSAAATITMCANPATVTAQTPDQTVYSGQQVTLLLPVVQPTAETKAITWFKGASGDRSTPVLSGTATRLDYQTPALTTTAQYWAEFTHNTCVSQTTTYTIRVCKPAITAQPQSTAITAGSQMVLTVAATGSPLSYQWYLGMPGDTTQPVGTSSNSYTAAPAVTTAYWVRVTGCSATADSAAATVTVCQAPTISGMTQTAEDRPLWPGSVAVTANGVALTYQWYYGQSGDVSRPIAGATAAEHAFTLQASEYYWVRVTSACSGASVNSAAILYNVQPRISVQPAGGVMCAGATPTFSVTATGNFLTYQWYRRVGTAAWELLTGATASSLTTVVTGPTRFKVYVSSGTSSIWSNEAVPTVNPRPTIQNIKKTWLSYTQDRLTAEVPQTDLDAGVTFKWYRGPLGTTTTLLSSNQSITVTPASPDSYWVRATFPSTACFSEAQLSY